MAAVGDFPRFDDPDKLVSYVGLNPKVRQSGDSAPVHGRISKAGRAQVRGVLVEAAWSARRAPGPLRAFYQRINARRGFQKAVVATARKMTILAWHLATRDEDYAFARPGLVTHKRRKLELAAGAPSPRGNHPLLKLVVSRSAIFVRRRREAELAHAGQVASGRLQPVLAGWSIIGSHQEMRDRRENVLLNDRLGASSVVSAQCFNQPIVLGCRLVAGSGNLWPLRK